MAGLRAIGPELCAGGQPRAREAEPDHHRAEPAARTAGAWAFGPLARVYDWQLPLERAPLQRTLTLAAARTDELLVDVGTGSGALLRMLAARAQAPRRAVGIDLSPAMLGRVGPLPPAWRLQCADARALPFDDDSVDVVTCAYLLHLLDAQSRRLVLVEIARVLRPHGRAALVTVVESRGLLGALVCAPLQRSACRIHGRRSAVCPLDPGPELSPAGLSAVKAHRVSRGYPSLCLLARPGG